MDEVTAQELQDAYTQSFNFTARQARDCSISELSRKVSEYQLDIQQLRAKIAAIDAEVRHRG